MSLTFNALKESHLSHTTDELHEAYLHISDNDVLHELEQPFAPFSIKRAMTLLSPSAEKHLEKMAQLSHQVTLQRFGKTMSLYVPLYVSNYCCNQCVYCGFNTDNKISRTRLTIEQAISEAELIAKTGFTDILLVSGEDPAHASVDYFAELTQRLRPLFSTISIEIYPLNKAGYQKLFAAGVDGVTLYQETYDSKLYPKYHPKGPKSDYESRLQAIENAASAGMRQLGIGSLVGLNDWRYEALCTALHAQTIMKNFWRTRISVSFPRMRPASGVAPEWLRPVSDKNLVQMITALRLCFADIGLVMSTREPAEFRDHLLPLGLTRISAGSSTSPGGYGGDEAEEQFAIADERSPQEVAQMLRQKKYEPVWKDWDVSFK